MKRKRSFEGWVNEVEVAITVRARLPWKIGDLLNYGEANYGERYAQALDERMVEYHTVQNWRWVCRAFEPSRRREALSWSHHEAVAALPERQQDSWLNIAERKRLSVHDLRDAVRDKTAETVINIDERFVKDFKQWEQETTDRWKLLKEIKRGTMQVCGIDKRNHAMLPSPLVKPKIKAA